jgi:hypothetical protein
MSIPQIRNGLEHEKKMSCGEAPRAYVTNSIIRELQVNIAGWNMQFTAGHGCNTQTTAESART